MYFLQKDEIMLHNMYFLQNNDKNKNHNLISAKITDRRKNLYKMEKTNEALTISFKNKTY